MRRLQVTKDWVKPGAVIIDVGEPGVSAVHCAFRIALITDGVLNLGIRWQATLINLDMAQAST